MKMIYIYIFIFGKNDNKRKADEYTYKRVFNFIFITINKCFSN